MTDTMVLNNNVKNFLILTILLTLSLLAGGMASADTSSYSTTYNTQYCSVNDGSCSSTNLQGVGTGCIQNSETNHPNTIDSCTSETCYDGGYTYYINQISVSTGDGQINIGDTITINVDVSNGGQASAAVWITTDVDNPSWTKIGEQDLSLGDQSASFSHVLGGSGGEYAIRANIINSDSETINNSCSTAGTLRDNDDLVFTVQSDTNTAPTIDSVTPTNNTIQENYNSTQELTATVSDAEAQDVTVTFKNDADDTTIGSNTVNSGGTASTDWTGLDSNTEYEWYATASDGTDTTTSGDYKFETRKINPEAETIPPIDVDFESAVLRSNVTVNDYNNDNITVNYWITTTELTDYSNTTTPRTIDTSTKGDSFIVEHDITGLENKTEYEYQMEMEYTNQSGSTENYYQSGFQTFTTTDYPNPIITLTTLESTDYDTIEWQASVETEYEVDWEIVLVDPETSTAIANQIGTTATDTTTTPYTYTGAEAGKTYNVYTYIDGEEYEATNVTTKEREPPNTNLISTGQYIDKIELELKTYNHDYENHTVEINMTRDDDGQEVYYNKTTFTNQTLNTVKEFNQTVKGLEHDTKYWINVTSLYEEDGVEKTSYYDERITYYTTTLERDDPNITYIEIDTISVSGVSLVSNLTSLGDAEENTLYIEGYETENPTETVKTLAYSPGWTLNDSYDNFNHPNVTATGIVKGGAENLDSDTDYTLRMCAENTNYNTLDCTINVTAKTGKASPDVTTLDPVSNYDLGITAKGRIELNDYDSVEYHFELENLENGSVETSPTSTVTSDSTVSYRYENLTERTNYEILMKATYDGTTTTTLPVTFKSDYEKSIESMWDTMLEANSWAKILGGVMITLSILFVGVKAFGSSNMQLGTYGIMILLFVGALISTVIGLFPTYILLLFLIGGVVLAVVKGLLFNNNSGGA